MNPSTARTTVLVTVLTFVTTPDVEAAWPVVDVRAIAQMVSQLRTMQNQLSTARDQLSEARNTLGALTGDRGMQHLLADIERNTLPINYDELADVLANTSAAYSVLSAHVQALINKNAVLTEDALEALTPTQRELVEEGRRNAAGLAAVTEQVLADSSERFNALQQLITSIGSATDPKDILDLQARVQSESVMLQNESTKLAALYQRQSAAAALRQLKIREQGIEDVGSLRDLPGLGL